MRALVRGVALRRVRLEPGRTALLVLGIALGVAVFTAVRALNATAASRIGQVGEVATGSAALIVDGSAHGVPLEALPRLRAVAGVKAASPIVLQSAREVAPGATGPADPGARRVMVLGLDLLDPAAREVAAQRDVGVLVDPAALLAERPALVAAPFARRRGLGARATFELFTASGRQAFTVAGVFDPKGAAAEITGGDIVVLPLPVALASFGREGRVDRVAVALADGADVDAVLPALRAAAGPDLRVSEPGDDSRRPAALLGTFHLGLTIASLLALVVGQFLIYNAMSIAVVRRRPELGVLRAVGTSRAQLALLLVAEAATFGVIGSALGLGLGALLAEAARELVNAQVTQLYAMLDARQVVLDRTTVLLGLVAGPTATVLASIPPIVSALAVSPVEAARKDLPRGRADVAIARLGLVGLALLGAALAAHLATATSGQSILLGALHQAAMAGGAALLAPWLAARLVRLLRPALAAGLGPTGALAADTLLVRPGRAGVTVAALMVALGGVLAIACLVSSLQRAITVWVEQVLVADLYVAASNPLGSQGNTLLDADALQAALTNIEGVSDAYPIRFVFEDATTEGRAGPRTGPAMLLAFDLGFLGAHSHIPATDAIEGGYEAAVKAILERPDDRIAVSSNFARARGIGVGDRVTLRTRAGPWSPQVVLCVVDYTSEHGCLYLHGPQFRERWADDRANAFDLFVRPGADPAAVAERIRSKIAPRYDLFVTENAAFRRKVLVVVEGAFTVTYAMQLIAIGVALLGVVTTLFATALERTRELGVLRAVGATRGHVRRAVVTEAAILGALAGLFAMPLGAGLGLGIVSRIISGTYGWELELVYPWGQALWGAGAATLLAALAGAVPAERAARIEVVRALVHE